MYTELKKNDEALKQELSDFLVSCFAPSDSIEIRLIETYREAGHGKSRLVGRNWITSEELLSSWHSLQRHNARGANVFFGVNPRRGQGGKKEDVAVCRILWADLDNARPEDESIWAALPKPSLVIDSGRGVHLYWRLSETIEVSSSETRSHIEEILKGMYEVLGSDSVQDVTRLLRLPGFLNVKNLRNGQSPELCRIASQDNWRLYRLSDFEAFKAKPETRPFEATSGEVLSATNGFRGTRVLRRVRGLIGLLDKETEDRSKRDFFVVTKLLSLGCTPKEITDLVSDHSKFKGNEAYLTRTLENAMRLVRQ